MNATAAGGSPANTFATKSACRGRLSLSKREDCAAPKRNRVRTVVANAIYLVRLKIARATRWKSQRHITKNGAWFINFNRKMRSNTQRRKVGITFTKILAPAYDRRTCQSHSKNTMSSTPELLPQPILSSTATAKSLLANDQLQMWLLDMRCFTREHALQATAIMSSDEQERAQKFARGRDEYIASRWLLRTCLARYGAQSAQQLQFQRTDKGKPYLMHGDVHFSLTHSGHWVLLAVGKVAVIGVDIEAAKPARDLIGIATHYYHPQELAHLQTLAGTRQHHYFYRLWTLKEAFFKALGTGISAGLEKAHFSLCEQRIAVALAPELATHSDAWQFHQWALASDDFCALAYQNGQALDISWFNALE
jgi:4'-phosphopantetheinyl transferase